MNVYETAMQQGATVIFITKPNPDDWLNPYSITKRAAEQLGQMYSREQEYQADIRGARLYSLYGPGQIPMAHGVRKAVPVMITNALEGKNIEVYGNGEQTATFLYITDAAEGLITLAQKTGLRGEIIAIAPSQDTEINELAETIKWLTDSTSKIVHLPRRGGEAENAKIVADTIAMKEKLGFEPKVALEDGLRETVAWIRRRYYEIGTYYSLPPEV